MDRSAGVLMHISSLPNDYLCGNFGRTAYEFVDFLADSGFKYWQVLPFFMPDNYFSPYMPISSYLGNPYFIDLEALNKEGLITSEELLLEKNSNYTCCEFEKLQLTRNMLLKKAAFRMEDKNAVKVFLEKNPEIKKAVNFYCLYLKNNGRNISEWKINDVSDEELFDQQFIQYVFYTQWNKLHNYAISRGIKIIGDLPFYVAPISSDVYYNKDEFLLNKDYTPKAVAGVPPDYFSKDGQLWGNPLYNFKKMEKNGFKYFKDKFTHLLNMFDGIRLDHFRAFSDFYAVPFNSESAKSGKWIKGPGTKLTGIINSLAKNKLIIAEDLGTIDDRVRELVNTSGFPGMAVFQFGFDGNFYNPHLPHNYKQNLVAYTGTHDNNTTLGFMWEADAATKNFVMDYIGMKSDNLDFSVDAIIRTLMRSNANLVILPIQDILAFGADTRMNTPGKADNNWRFRVTKDQLKNINRDYFKRLNQMYSR